MLGLPVNCYSSACFGFSADIVILPLFRLLIIFDYGFLLISQRGLLLLSGLPASGEVG